jgi:hypothetical protein
MHRNRCIYSMIWVVCFFVSSNLSQECTYDQEVGDKREAGAITNAQKSFTTRKAGFSTLMSIVHLSPPIYSFTSLENLSSGWHDNMYLMLFDAQ